MSHFHGKPKGFSFALWQTMPTWPCDPWPAALRPYPLLLCWACSAHEQLLSSGFIQSRPKSLFCKRLFLSLLEVLLYFLSQHPAYMLRSTLSQPVSCFNAFEFHFYYGAAWKQTWCLYDSSWNSLINMWWVNEQLDEQNALTRSVTCTKRFEEWGAAKFR